MLQIFERALMSTARWEATFKEAQDKDPSTPLRSSISRGRNPSPIEEQEWGDMVGEEASGESVPASFAFLTINEMEQVDGQAAPVWMTSVDNIQDPLDWTSMVREECAAIEHIRHMVDNLNRSVPSIETALNTRYQPLMENQGQDIKRVQ